MTQEKLFILRHRFQRIGSKYRGPGEPHIWNDEWERQNQALLKQQYEEAEAFGVSTGIRLFYCRGCRRPFYTTVASKKYCSYHTCGEKMLKLKWREERWKARRDTVCMECGRLFTPKRNDAKYCSSACRQKAHRSRTASSASGGSPQP